MTESSLLADSSQVKTLLNAIKKCDIHLSLNEFETAYSSMPYLADLPKNILKF